MQQLPERLRHFARLAGRDDVLAGAIVAVLLIPQALAYALLAGLPPQVGIYASLLPLLAYAAIGGSRLSAVGPAAVIALMTAQVMAPVVGPDGVSPAWAAVVLATEVGLLLALAAALKLDALAALLGAPVLQGFSVGAAISITLSQLPALIGNPARGSSAYDIAVSAWQGAQSGAWLDPATAAFGIGALLLLVVSRRGLQRLAEKYLPLRHAVLVGRTSPLLVIVLGIALSWAASAATHGVAVVGPLPDLRLPLAWPQFDAALWWRLLPGASLIALVTFVSSFAVAERLGLQRGEHVEGRREMMGLAASNLVAGVSGGMPVAGSFSRSAVNAEAGARTRMAGVWAAVFMAIVVMLLATPLSLLPRAVLAASIVLPVVASAEWGAFGQAWRYSRGEALVMLLVAVMTVAIDMQWALGLGVLVSIALLLQHTARPHAALIGRVPGTEHFRNVARHETVRTPGVLSLRIDESLLFINARELVRLVMRSLEGDPDTQRVILHMAPVNRIDLSGLEALRTLQGMLQERRVRLDFSEIKGPVLDGLRAGSWNRWFQGRVYLTHLQAVNDEAGMPA